MSIRKIFKSHLPSVNYFFSNGMQGAFMLGRFETDIPYQIQELTNEVKSGHPHIYIDQAEEEIDSEAPTPMELIRAEAYAQAKADLLAAGAMSGKVSASDSGKFSDSVANTATIAEAASGSDSGSASQALNAAGAPAAATGASLMALSALKSK
jgi:hypothetical protein